MMGDVELVLRFFALREPERMDLSYKDYLSAYMGRWNKEYQTNASLEGQDEAEFKRAVENSRKIFGSSAFEKRSGVRSAPLADAMMTSLSMVRPERVDAALAASLRVELASLISEAAFDKAITSGTNGKGAIRTRIEMARAAVRRAAPASALT